MSREEIEKTFKLTSEPGKFEDLKTSSVVCLKGLYYKIVKELKVSSGEADVFVVEEINGGEQLIFKYYRHGIEPKLEIIKELKSIASEKVIKLIDYGVAEGERFYELQEFARYGSFDFYIKSGSSVICDSFIREFVRELDECLADIHSHNIIHRDIKPANILIRSLKPLKIALSDFGISSISQSLIHQTNVNRTIAYAAPEAMTGVVSRASDYWALGIIALELISGRHPFDNMDARTVTYHISTREVPGIDEVKSDFYPLLKGTLNRDDKKRWGHSQVSDWLEYRIKSDFFEPFSFYGQKCLDLKEVSCNLIVNWERAASDVMLIKHWIVKNCSDKGVTTLISEVDVKRLSNDIALFELICFINPDVKITYKKRNITLEFLSEIAWRVFESDASNEEIELLNEIICEKIIVKYYEIAGRKDEDFVRYSSVYSACETAGSSLERASAVLGVLAPERLRASQNPMQKIARYIKKNKYSANAVYFVAISAILILAFIIIVIVT